MERASATQFTINGAEQFDLRPSSDLIDRIGSNMKIKISKD